MSGDKTIMFLGASHNQVAPIKKAKLSGYTVVTCDNRPQNPGHAFADYSYDVSVRDHNELSLIADRHRIDGIVSYGSDVGALSAAVVSQNLGLVGFPPESVAILTNKKLWREFLATNGFNVPSIHLVRELNDLELAISESKHVLLKPADSSGSKGITELCEGLDSELAKSAISRAKKFTTLDYLVAEQFIVRKGPQLAGDLFVIEGKIAHAFIGDENFDDAVNGLVPVAQTFPSSRRSSDLDVAIAEVQRVVSLLNLKQGALNVDIIFDSDGRVYLLEVGPRNGGCRIPELCHLATGFNAIDATLDTCLGRSVEPPAHSTIEGAWSTYMIHSRERGSFWQINSDEQLLSFFVDLEMWVRPGCNVEAYLSSAEALGSGLIRASSVEVTKNLLERLNSGLVSVS